MKVTIEPTSQMILMGGPTGIIETRIWEGTIEGGQPIYMAVALFTVKGDELAELGPVREPSPDALKAFEDYAKLVALRMHHFTTYGGDDDGRPN